MAAGANVPQGSGLEHPPFSAEFQNAVKAELDAMLKAPIFAQSNRCKRFLSYVVLQTLSGNASELKERTIGISVFDRTNDYDTGDDSIVRVTANEVRKRLGQFYRESALPHPIQIELPRGSYVPEFRIQPSRHAHKPVEIASPERAAADSRASVVAGQPPPLPVPLEIGAGLPDVAPSRRITPRHLPAYSIVALLLAAAVAVVGVWRQSESRNVPDLWGAFLHANLPVLVCIDTHDLAALSPEPPADRQIFVNLVLRRQSISLDDAAILSSMASELGRRGVPFRVVGADQTTLADLRRQPVILIGAIDNQWTLLLTQTLPYRIEVANPPGSGGDQQPIASIVESARPAGARWVTDFSVPFPAWKSDYGVVARVDDPTTGVPVMIEAGLGNNGTVAANEWITSGALAKDLKQQPSCRNKANFEAVIETQMIDTKSGPPHILRLTCW
ncbi:MAG TPA: hypothetical protein VKT75_08170 [Acidobacteriaceae bacterium]|nr:hypothetical protein [Acidobacteriaceae bacterium]